MTVLTIVVAVLTFACLGLSAWFGGSSATAITAGATAPSAGPARTAGAVIPPELISSSATRNTRLMRSGEASILSTAPQTLAFVGS
jgi:hypothetical protein